MKAKHLFMLLFTTIALVLAGCSNNPAKTAENFEKIIEENDAKALYEAVEKEEGLVWTEKNAEETIKYLNENKDEKRSLIAALKDQAVSIKEKLTLYDDYGMFYFDEEGNIHVRAYELSIANYYDDLTALTIKVADEEYDIKNLMDDTFTFGKFGPGNYEVVATAKYDYAEIKDEAEVSLFNAGSFKEHVDMSLDGETVYLYTNYPNTKLKINGELTDIILENSMEFGPISSDTKIQAVVSFPWGDSESDEYVAGEQYDIDFKVPILSEGDSQKEITRLLNQFVKNYVSAYVNLDTGKLKDISDNMNVSVHDDIEFAKQYDYTYKGKVHGTRIDFSNVKYSVEGGERYYIQLPIEIHWAFDRFSSYNKNNKASESYDGYIVTLRYLNNDKTWEIDKMNSTYNFGSNSNPDEIVKTEFDKEDKEEKKDDKKDDKQDKKDDDKDDKGKDDKENKEDDKK